MGARGGRPSNFEGDAGGVEACAASPANSSHLMNVSMRMDCSLRHARPATIEASSS